MIRILDVLLASLASLLLSPILLPVAAILRVTGEKEVFYLQSRVGAGGREFHLIKFATMLKNSPSLGTGPITLRDDPRVLPFGKFLRKSKINELPQLFNILIGDMSLIGPRPLTRSTFDAYSRSQQMIIESVKPGLSGVGSIIFRDEEGLLSAQSNPLNFYREVIAPYKAQLEEWYVSKSSVYFYLALIAITCWIVVFSKSRIMWRVFSDLPVMPEDLRL